MTQHYFTSKPHSAHDERAIQVELAGVRADFCTDAGVFSRDGLDFGSRLLIETVHPLLHGRVLDMGCGWGAIGVLLARLCPDAQITMADINERAVALAARNARQNGVSAETLVSDGYENIAPSVDAIVTNPPIRAGQGDFLRFAAGDFHAARVVIAVERGIQPPGHGGKPLAKARAQQRAFRRGTVVFHARAHILPQREGEQPEILEYHGEERLIFLIAVFADVDAVERDCALGGVVQAAEQLDHGGFAAAIPAHHGHALAHAQREVQILQRVVLRAGIAEGYVVKGDLEFIVEALFHGQRAAIERVRHVQIIVSAFLPPRGGGHLAQKVCQAHAILRQAVKRRAKAQHGSGAQRAR